jgi:hypothetical protein
MQTKSLLYPLLAHDVVDIGVLVLVSVSVDLVVAANEGPLVKGIFARHVSCLADLVKLCVEKVAAS